MGLPGVPTPAFPATRAFSRRNSDFDRPSANPSQPLLSGVLLCLTASAMWACGFRKATGETAMIPELGEVGLSGSTPSSSFLNFIKTLFSYFCF